MKVVCRKDARFLLSTFKSVIIANKQTSLVAHRKLSNNIDMSADKSANKAKKIVVARDAKLGQFSSIVSARIEHGADGELFYHLRPQ
jgi:hypothetical protein